MMLTLIKIVKMSIKIVATMRMTKTMMGLSRYAVSMLMMTMTIKMGMLWFQQRWRVHVHAQRPTRFCPREMPQRNNDNDDDCCSDDDVGAMIIQYMCFHCFFVFVIVFVYDKYLKCFKPNGADSALLLRNDGAAGIQQYNHGHFVMAILILKYLVFVLTSSSTRC